MSVIIQFTLRNIRVYLRDRAAVFFSLLSVFIIIGLYAFFLGDVNVRSLESMATGADPRDIRWLVDSWIMAGILVVNGITVTLGVFGTVIDDETHKKINGFLIAPVSRSRIVIGYLLAANLVGLFLSFLAFVLAEFYIIGSGGQGLPPLAMLQVLGLITLNVVSSASLVFLLISFVRSSGGFSLLSTILGTTIGFLTGIYVPVGVLPDSIQLLMKFIPATHTAAMMRQIFMAAPMEKVFAGAPAEVTREYADTFGMNMTLHDQVLGFPVMIAFVAVTGLVFLILSIIRMNHRKIRN